MLESTGIWLIIWTTNELMLINNGHRGGGYTVFLRGSYTYHLWTVVYYNYVTPGRFET